MDFRLTPAQELLVSNAREFFQHHCPTTLVQDIALDPHGFAEDLWRHISALGWPGLLIPAAFGGSDGSVLDVALLVEAMGHACFPSPYVHSAVIATALLLGADNPSLQQRFLPSMAQGKRLCTLALTEESADFLPTAVSMVGDIGEPLNGCKLFVHNAHIADDLIVVVRGGGGYNLVIVERHQPGITLVPLESMTDEKVFAVTFSGIEITPDTLLGPVGGGWEVLAPVLQLGALVRCAEMVGCAQRILEICVDYAKIREQSGRAIGAFQAIQHHCADLLRHVEGSRYLVYHAAWQIASGMDGSATIAMAKAYANEACLSVARKGHQILGAMGYCEEHPLHLFHKRILAASLDFGDAAMHLETVATTLGLA